METRFISGFKVSFSERRLCHDQTGPSEKFIKQGAQEKLEKSGGAAEKAAVQKQTGENLQKAKTDVQIAAEKKLRADLQQFAAEIRKGNQLQEAQKKGVQPDEKAKKVLEDQRDKERGMLNTLVRDLGAADPAFLKILAVEARTPGLTAENFGTDLQRIFNTETSRKELLDGVSRIQNGNMPNFLQGGDQGILNLAQSVVKSQGAQNVIAEIRKRGVDISDETILKLIFVGIRGFFANLIANSPSLSAMPEMRERARQMHYRMALETHLRAKNQNNGFPQLGLMETVALPTPELEGRALGRELTPLQKSEIRTRWNALYDGRQAVAIKARANRSTTNPTPVPPMPTLDNALTDAAEDAYCTTNNVTTTAVLERRKKSAGTKAEQDKKDADTKLKEKTDKEIAVKERPAIVKAVEEYNARTTKIAQITVDPESTATGVSLVVTTDSRTPAQIVELAQRPAGSHTDETGNSVRFSGLSQKAVSEMLERFTKNES